MTLVLLTAFIWGQVYTAQFLEYDENFGQLIMAFLISMALLIVGIVVILRKVKLVMNNLILSIGFLFINSPFTIFFVVMNYPMIFGARLDVG